MRISRFPLTTSREIPAGAEIISHQLMLRSGMIRQHAAGIYTWMPLGLRVLRKVETIIREEMEQTGAIELLMPSFQPAELWQASGRWEQYGPELLRLQDRGNRSYCLGPTHEEVITDLLIRDIHSHKQLPLIWFQIQTKFRDEIRPRFGVMRAREFIMKDAYSFHLHQNCLEEVYQRMHQAYQRIFQRLGLDFRVVRADSGTIGGEVSHEFHILADSGEDTIAVCEQSDYGANLEWAPTFCPAEKRAEPGIEMTAIDVQNLKGTGSSKCVSIISVAGENGNPVALALRGDHSLNSIKAARLSMVASPLRLLPQAMETGPIGITCPLVVDYAAAAMADFVCANGQGGGWAGVNWGRDLPEPEVADLRNVKDGDPSPDGRGILRLRRGIEAGHIFQLGTKYSEAMGARITSDSGQKLPVIMGCYGIGVSRIPAAAIEQNHDEAGIIWPESIAPFYVALLPINAHRSEVVHQMTLRIEKALLDAEIEVLVDDRGLRPGVMFADIELIGIPHLVVIGERSATQGMVEYRMRHQKKAITLEVEDLLKKLQASPGA